MSELTVRHFRGRQGLEAIRGEWKALIGAMSSKRYFHLHEYHMSYMDSVEDDPEAVVFTVVYRQGTPVAILPVVLRTERLYRIPLRVMRLYPDTSHLEGLTDCVVAENSGLSLSVMLQALREYGLSWHMFYVRKIMEHSCLRALLQTERRVKTIQEAAGWNDFLTKDQLDRIQYELISKGKKESNKKLRQLQRLGSTEIKRVQDPEAMADAFETFLRLEASGWKGSQGTAIGINEKKESFYSRIIQNLSGIGCAEIDLLQVAGHSIAGILGFTVDGTFYTPKIAYDEDYVRYSPGIVLAEQVFKGLSERGAYRECNFISHTRWASRWKPEKCPTYRVFLFNSTFLGHLGFSAFRLVRRLWKRPHPGP